MLAFALGLCVALWALAPQPSAHAQSTQETAMARALFEEGVKLADQAKWPEAVDRFRRAQSLKPTPAIAFNLACALAENGQLVEASEMLEALAREPSAPADLKHESEAKLAEIGPKRAYLTLNVEGAPSEAKVEVDGHEWPRAGWGVASPVDPGNHAVVGKTGDVEATREEFAVLASERKELTLSWPSAAPLVETSAPAPVVPAPTKSERKPLYKNWILWTCVGAAIAGGVVAGVVVGSKGDKTTEPPVQGNAGTIRW
ncbi:MAG: hypothetical protein QM778_22055 [Myxococcales bacterium]